MPEVLPAPAVNVAFRFFFGSKFERSAVSEVMLWPSGSEALTTIVSRCPEVAIAVAGATTIGARSVLATVIAVVAEAERAFEAVKVTL